jgi:hypothetical protein
MASLLFATAESLTKSCLYFTPENLALLPLSPDLASLWEDADGVTRAALLQGLDHQALVPTSQAEAGIYDRLPGLRDQIMDLQIVAGTTRHVIQLFRLLRRERTPPGALDPLRHVADAGIRLLRAAALALQHDDFTAADIAIGSFFEVAAAAHEHRKTLRQLPQYLPPHLIRMNIAAHVTLLVLTKAAARVAHRFANPPKSPPRRMSANSIPSNSLIR